MAKPEMTRVEAPEVREPLAQVVGEESHLALVAEEVVRKAQHGL